MWLEASDARKLLAAVRLFNGAAGLFAPEFLLRRLGVDPKVQPSGVYPFRMFGIRTILLGADLLFLRGEQRRRATQLAVLIHGSDTVSAATAAIRGDLPRRAGVMTTLISAGNTALAVAATRGGGTAPSGRELSDDKTAKAAKRTGWQRPGGDEHPAAHATAG